MSTPDSTVNVLTALLPKALQPVAKAVYALVVPLVVAIVSAISTGNVNDTEIKTSAGGLVLAIVVYFVGNRPR